MSDHADLRALLASLDPKARDDLRRGLIRDQAESRRELMGVAPRTNTSSRKYDPSDQHGDEEGQRH
jgi:hypothetical protein